MKNNDAVIKALRETLERDPKNVALRAHYVELLLQDERTDEAIEALRVAIELGGDTRTLASQLIPLLRDRGQLAEALIRAEKLLEEEDDPDLRLEFARILHARGDVDGAREQYRLAIGDPEADFDPGEVTGCQESSEGPSKADVADQDTNVAGEEPPKEIPSKEATEEREPQAATVVPEGTDSEDWASQFDWGDLHTTFDDVAGLDDVKRQIHLRIIAPFKNPEIYQAFGRQGGGGILLYGPPGCGKTYIAKATAGECGARFVSVGIHDIVDKYWGESEKLIHTLFEDARQRSPTVLFFDEFDALGSSRGRSESQFWKTMVDQLLQEMDGIQGRNDDLLVFAATNIPWNVDSAFRRPGRFDRVLFVPPPDLEARRQILEMRVQKLPGGDAIDTASLAKKARLFTGADLNALCERASEHALSRSFEKDEVQPVTAQDFALEMGKIQSSALEWLSTARNYAKYSNESGQYDELVEFLRRAKKW